MEEGKTPYGGMANAPWRNGQRPIGEWPTPLHALKTAKKQGRLTLLLLLWALRDSNPRPSACKADALNQLS